MLHHLGLPMLQLVHTKVRLIILEFLALQFQKVIVPVQAVPGIALWKCAV